MGKGVGRRGAPSSHSPRAARLPSPSPSSSSGLGRLEKLPDSGARVPGPALPSCVMSSRSLSLAVPSCPLQTGTGQALTSPGCCEAVVRFDPGACVKPPGSGRARPAWGGGSVTICCFCDSSPHRPPALSYHSLFATPLQALVFGGGGLRPAGHGLGPHGREAAVPRSPAPVQLQGGPAWRWSV